MIRRKENTAHSVNDRTRIKKHAVAISYLRNFTTVHCVARFSDELILSKDPVLPARGPPIHSLGTGSKGDRSGVIQRNWVANPGKVVPRDGRSCYD